MFATRKPITFRKAMLNALLVPVGFAVGAGLVYAAPLAMDVQPSQPQQQEQVERPVAPGSPQALIEKHGCWTGDAPAHMQGVLPGHAVVTYHGDTAPTYGGSKAVGDALEHVFEGQHPDLTVHAFCE